jgi:Vitamin K-dependent gamma-carboxylase
MTNLVLHSTNFLNSLTTERWNPSAARLLRKAVYCWCLINTIILLPDAGAFWSSSALTPSIPTEIVQAQVWSHLLSLPRFQNSYGWFLALQLLLLVLGIACVYPRIISILIYLVTINLDNKVYVILDGGNNLIHLFLIYFIFIDPSKKTNQRKDGFFFKLSNAFTNLAFLMCRLQIVMMYLISGLSKVGGALWQNGTALYYTLQVDEYTHPLAKDLVSRYPLLTVAGSYLTLLYQVVFPWLVWNRKVRPWLLSVGSLIHLQISFVMGLFMFGFAIAVAYLSFASESFAEKILAIPARTLKLMQTKHFRFKKAEVSSHVKV